jgi:hypothetical protein
VTILPGAFQVQRVGHGVVPTQPVASTKNGQGFVKLFFTTRNKGTYQLVINGDLVRDAEDNPVGGLTQAPFEVP